MTLYIFDKDQTLCPGVLDSRGKTHPPNRLSEQTYFDGVKERCAELIIQGHTLAVASNQGGVAFGIFSERTARELVKAAADYIGAASYAFCPFHPKGKVTPWNMDHYTRKPQPGMLQDLMDELGFEPEDTIMVGDWDSDEQAAEAAGCHFINAALFFGREEKAGAP